MSLWQITWFTGATALGATLLVLPFGIATAWLLARRSFPGKALIETAVSLPLVVPPVATGLLLLKLFGPRGPAGRALSVAGIEVIFTWKAVVLAMAVMGFPLLVRTVMAGFEQIDRRYEQIAATLGAHPLRVFLTISLPLAARAIFAGAMLALARALGEFGATIMVAGSIPGQTRTIPVAIFSFTETGRDGEAVGLMLVSVTLAFVALLTANRLTRAARS
jgi:molybdate transport system permease protein